MDQSPIFVYAITGTAIVLIICRWLLEKLLSLQPKGTQLIPADSESPLRPTEIAYLLRRGDIGHTMLVMGADLTQRALKSYLSPQSIPPVSPYEAKMWELAKNSVQSWAQKKTESYIPGDFAEDPLTFVRRVSNLYRFFAHTVRNFVGKVIEDPKHIRKYFSLGGMIRLVIDFSSAGYQQSFAKEVQLVLLSRNMLVHKERRKQFALLSLGVSAIGLALCAIVTIKAIAPLALALLTLFLSLASAFVMRVIFILREAIPLYSELVDAITHVERKSWRLTLLKNILSSVRGISWFLCIFIFLGCLLLSIAILKVCFPRFALDHMFLVAALTLASFVIIDLAIQSVELQFEERPTASAQLALKEVKKSLAHVSPLETFKQMLISSEYKPLFSEVLAVYGIETLLFLG